VPALDEQVGVGRSEVDDARLDLILVDDVADPPRGVRLEE
jgi:hypothetical protein